MSLFNSCKRYRWYLTTSPWPTPEVTYAQFPLRQKASVLTWEHSLSRKVYPPPPPWSHNFISCSFLTKLLPTCTILKIMSSPSLLILFSSESMGTPQRITSLIVHPSTYHQTLTCVTAIVFLISVLVSAALSYNPFSTQEPMWSFKNMNQLVSLKISWWLPFALEVRSKLLTLAYDTPQYLPSACLPRGFYLILFSPSPTPLKPFCCFLLLKHTTQKAFALTPNFYTVCSFSLFESQLKYHLIKKTFPGLFKVVILITFAHLIFFTTLTIF